MDTSAWTRALNKFGLDDPFDNLVAKALGKLPRDGGLAVTLEKNLPVAAGLGGGEHEPISVIERYMQRPRHRPPDRCGRAGL